MRVGTKALLFSGALSPKMRLKPMRSRSKTPMGESRAVGTGRGDGERQTHTDRHTHRHTHTYRQTDRHTHTRGERSAMAVPHAKRGCCTSQSNGMSSEWIGNYLVERQCKRRGGLCLVTAARCKSQSHIAPPHRHASQTSRVGQRASLV